MLYSDAENLWTPNRLRAINVRNEAIRSLRMAADAKANASQNTLVKPFDSPDHSFRHNPDEDSRGILFSDGSIHIWNYELEHYDYLTQEGLTLNVQAAGCREEGRDGGWGFYFNGRGDRERWYDGAVIRPYNVPADLVEELERTILEAEDAEIPSYENLSLNDPSGDHLWEIEEIIQKRGRKHETQEEFRNSLDEIFENIETACDGCSGDGRYPLRNGNFGTCFRCSGKGKQNGKDRKRNAAYDAKKGR